MKIKESCKQRLGRKTKNAWTRSIALVKKVGPLSQAQALELQVKARKQAFGVQFMDELLASKQQQEAAAGSPGIATTTTTRAATTSQQKLATCVQQTKQDLEILYARIASLKAQAEHIEERTQAKLVRKPKPSSSTPPPREPVSAPSFGVAMNKENRSPTSSDYSFTEPSTPPNEAPPAQQDHVMSTRGFEDEEQPKGTNGRSKEAVDRSRTAPSLELVVFEDDDDVASAKKKDVPSLKPEVY